MRTHTPSTDPGRLLDAAKRRAEELRNAAMDELFQSAADATRHTLRSARRFAASLARHSRLRAQREA